MSNLLAKGLTKIYNKRKVVNNIDLSISPGEVVGLLIMLPKIAWLSVPV